MACDLHCCLPPQCEALRTCRSGFPIATPLGKKDLEKLKTTETVVSQQF